MRSATGSPIFSIPEALGLGDGNLSALVRGGGGSWKAEGARGLLQAVAPDCLRIEPGDGPHANFALAAAHWIAGEDERAQAVLARIADHPPAKRLAALIGQPFIDVLSFLPQDRRQMHQLAAAADADSKFRLRNVSFGAGDLANRPDADIRSFYADGHPPDFVIAEMVEWQLLPRNLRACPAPLIGHTSDLDMHIQSLLPWLDQFDALLTVGDSEWEKLVRLVGAERSLVYPPVFSVEPCPPAPSETRPIDFVLSATVLSPTHRDKEAVLKNIIELPGLEYVLHNGSMPLAAFQRLLQASKLTLGFIRHPESMPTRAMEALAAGCCCLIPKSSTLHFYVPPEHGLVPVDFDDRAALERAVLAVTRDEVERYRIAAERGAALMRDRFPAAKIGSRYLRFLTVLAATIGPSPVRSEIAEPALQKNHSCWIGALPDNGRPETMAALRSSNLTLGKHLSPVHRFNEAGRGAILNYELFGRWLRAPSEPGLVTEALSAFRKAVDAAPDALAPALNFVRTAFHFGDEMAKVEATLLAEEIVSRPRADWGLGFDDDLLTYDFYPTHAPTRLYVEHLNDLASGKDGAEAALIVAVLATFHFYRGWRSETVEPFKECHRLVPDFVEGRLQLARALVETDDPASAREALEHLLWLNRRYIVAAELPDLIARAQRIAGLPEDPPHPHAGLRLIDNLGDYFADFSVVEKASRYRFEEARQFVWRRNRSDSSASLILIDRHQRWLRSIENLSEPLRQRTDGLEIVYSDLFAATDEWALAFADVALRQFWPAGVVEHVGRAFCHAFVESAGDVLIFAERLDGVSADGLVGAIEAIKARPLDRIVIQAWPELGMPTPRPQLVAISRPLFIELGGFDVAIACQGARGGVRELVWRARNAGSELLGLDLETVYWAAALSLDAGALATVAQVIEIVGKPEWRAPGRTRPIYPDRHIQARTMIKGGSLS